MKVQVKLGAEDDKQVKVRFFHFQAPGVQVLLFFGYLFPPGGFCHFTSQSGSRRRQQQTEVRIKASNHKSELEPDYHYRSDNLVKNGGL